MRRTIRIGISNCTVTDFVPVAARFGSGRYGFAVTPNVDHLIRLIDDGAFYALYGQATFTLFDSRFAAKLVHAWTGQKLPVCTGSDLTAALFNSVIQPLDRLVIVGLPDRQLARLLAVYGLQDVRHFNPPLATLGDASVIDQCVRFVEEQSPFRFCFLALGSPQQEIIAQRLQANNIARGLTLCVGSALRFLTGNMRRAPLWLQRNGLEWLHRLCMEPRRLAYRYLVRCPRIFLWLSSMKFELHNLQEGSTPRSQETCTPAQLLAARPDRRH